MSKANDSASGAQSKSLGAEAAPLLDSALYLVATPIGNLQDISLRALHVLRHASVIACEDTRTSKTLLAHYDIHTKLVSYHEHNASQMRPKLVARLMAGDSVALISDAGTPLISDPGYKLVREVQAAGVAIVPIPGACAAITALCASGLATDRFAFLGFLPAKTSARSSALQSMRNFAGTLVLYESPRRVMDTLREIEAAFGNREVVLARELTKHFEEILRLPIGEMLIALEARPALKGEVVLLIGAGEDAPADSEQIDALLRDALLQGCSTKEAVQQVAELTGAAKSQLYARALELKNAN